jgi:HK97 family phage prohead protease
VRDLQVVRAYRPGAVRDATGDAADSDVLGTLHGHFSVFDTWYPVRSWWEGDFVERIVPGAFRKTMSERRNQIVVAFDHGMDPVIGDKVLGGITDLREDDTGAYYEVDLLDTSYNRDLAPALRRDLYSASFRFQVLREEWVEEPERSDHNPDGLRERTIREVRLYEFGPVTYPANPAATASMRCVTDDYYDKLRSIQPRYVEGLAERLRNTRTPKAGSPANGAASPTDAPADQGHPSGLSPHARARMLAVPSLTIGSRL